MTAAALTGSAREITLADGPHMVKFTIEAFIRLEAEFDGLGGLDDALKKRPFTAARTLLWVGLGCDRKVEEVGRLMEGVPIAQLAETLGEALADAVGAGGNGSGPTGAAPGTPETGAPTGPSSSP